MTSAVSKRLMPEARATGILEALPDLVLPEHGEEGVWAGGSKLSGCMGCLSVSHVFAAAAAATGLLTRRCGHALVAEEFGVLAEGHG